MKKIQKFFYEIGIEPNSELTEKAKKKLKDWMKTCDLNDSMHRKHIINIYSNGVGEYRLRKWEHFIDIKNMSTELHKRAEIIIDSILIYYYILDHSINCELIIKPPIKNGVIDRELKEILNLIEPGWELSFVFMTDEEKEQIIEKIIIRKVEEVMEKTNILNEMYTTLPELLKKELMN